MTNQYSNDQIRMHKNCASSVSISRTFEHWNLIRHSSFEFRHSHLPVRIPPWPDQPIPRIPTSTKKPSRRMTFGEHLEELRKRIIRAPCSAPSSLSTLCIYFYKFIIDIITRPYKIACLAHGVNPILTTPSNPRKPSSPPSPLSVQAGLMLASPWIIYQLWQFVAAGLYARERKIVYRYTAPSALLFLLGIAFFYLIVLPMTLNFFITFTTDTSRSLPTPNFIERFMGITIPQPPAATHPPTTTSPATTAATATAPTTLPAVVPIVLPILAEDPPPPSNGQASLYLDSRDGEIKARTPKGVMVFMISQEGSLFSTTWRFDDYLSFVMFTALIFGIAFEIPMVMLVLSQVGIVEPNTYRSSRKYAYFAILIAAVIAAPSGDPMTLILLFTPLVALYELGILAAAFVTRNRDQ